MSRFSAKTIHLNQVNFKYKLYQEEEQKTIKKMLNIIPPKNNGKLKPIQLKKNLRPPSNKNNNERPLSSKLKIDCEKRPDINYIIEYINKIESNIINNDAIICDTKIFNLDNNIPIPKITRAFDRDEYLELIKNKIEYDMENDELNPSVVHSK